MGEAYTLSDVGYHLNFAKNIEKLTDAVISFNSLESTVTVTGTPVEGGSQTPDINQDEKIVSISPDPAVASNLFNSFVLTFGGYNTVTVLNPAMYDPMTGPVTFTEVSTGIVRSKGGAIPSPMVDNTAVITLGQTIFNREYVIEAGTEDKDDLPYYEAHDMLRANGAYILEIPAACLELNDGTAPVPNEAMTFLYTLGTDVTGIETIAPEFSGMDIYTLGGVRVVKAATAADINALPAGLYIVGGKKVAVK